MFVKVIFFYYRTGIGWSESSLLHVGKPCFNSQIMQGFSFCHNGHISSGLHQASYSASVEVAGAVTWSVNLYIVLKFRMCELYLHSTIFLHIVLLKYRDFIFCGCILLTTWWVHIMYIFILPWLFYWTE